VLAMLTCVPEQYIPNRIIYSHLVTMKSSNCSVCVCEKSAVIRWLCLYGYSILKY
jgi:hypothetical protein